MTARPYPRVSVIMATHNEEKFIERCVLSVLEGTFPHDQLEIIVADGMSTDRTREIVQRLARQYPCVRLIDNPERIAPTAFNRAIKASRGDTILLLSAHSQIDPNYIRIVLDRLEQSGADMAGGIEVALPPDATLHALIATAILGSRFGVGSSYRTRLKEGYVDTVGPALYRREVFERIGLFDERLVRNQDNELNARLRAAGGRVWMTVATRTYYFGRGTIAALLRQNYRNGFYAMLNWRITPASFSLRHAVPVLFVAFVVLGAVAAIFNDQLARIHASIHDLPGAIYLFVLGLYVLLVAVSAVGLALRHRRLAMLLTFFIFPLLHLYYGIGTLAGIFRFGLARIRRIEPEKLQPRPPAT
jgi:glycosyltransferase involved in cell wall biosynthesis